MNPLLHLPRLAETQAGGLRHYGLGVAQSLADAAALSLPGDLAGTDDRLAVADALRETAASLNELASGLETQARHIMAAASDSLAGVPTVTPIPVGDGESFAAFRINRATPQLDVFLSILGLAPEKDDLPTGPLETTAFVRRLILERQLLVPRPQVAALAKRLGALGVSQGVLVPTRLTRRERVAGMCPHASPFKVRRASDEHPRPHGARTFGPKSCGVHGGGHGSRVFLRGPSLDLVSLEPGGAIGRATLSQAYLPKGSILVLARRDVAAPAA